MKPVIQPITAPQRTISEQVTWKCPLSPDTGMSFTQASSPQEQTDPSAGGYLHSMVHSGLFLPASPKVVHPVGKNSFLRERREGL